MSNVDEYITYIFTWRTSHDDRVCQWCNPLDGQVIFFDLFSDILISDIAGPVWDLNADHSLLHGASGTCRCSLDIEVEVDWERIAEFNELKTNLELMDIQINLGKEVFKLSSVISEARNQMQGFFSDLKQLTPAVAETNSLLTTYVALSRRLGLPPNIMDFIAKMQQARITVQMLHRSIMLLYTSTGPIGWVIGLGGLALGGLMMADQMEMRRPRY